MNESGVTANFFYPLIDTLIHFLKLFNFVLEVIHLIVQLMLPVIIFGRVSGKLNLGKLVFCLFDFIHDFFAFGHKSVGLMDHARYLINIIPFIK